MKFIKIYYYGEKDLHEVKPENDGSNTKKSFYSITKLPEAKIETGKVCHEVFLLSHWQGKIYDLDKDLLRLKHQAKKISKNQSSSIFQKQEVIWSNLEKLLLDTGYRGWSNLKFNTIVIFHDKDQRIPISKLKPIGEICCWHENNLDKNTEKACSTFSLNQ